MSRTSWPTSRPPAGLGKGMSGPDRVREGDGQARLGSRPTSRLTSRPLAGLGKGMSAPGRVREGDGQVRFG